MTVEGNVIKGLMDKFGDAVVVAPALSDGTTSIVIEKARLRDVLLFLKTDEQYAYEMLTDLFGVDHQGREPRFEIIYLLTSLKSKGRIAARVRCSGDEEIPTVSDLWKAAEWLEREAYDMFGIGFLNHPDLRRILMVEDFNGYPLRKDFPTEGYGFNEPFRVTLEEKYGSWQKIADT